MKSLGKVFCVLGHLLNMEGVWSFGNLMFLVHSNELSRMSFCVSGNLILKKVRSKGDRVI